MQILLVNDVSGVHEYLYRGLIELGHECELVPFDRPTIAHITHARNFFPLKNWGIIGKSLRPIINLSRVRSLPYYDVVSFMHRISFINKPHFLRYVDTPLVSEKTQVMSYTALGCDELGYLFENPVLPYRPCESCERQDEAGQYCIKVNRPSHSKATSVLNKYFNVVTSPAIEYDHIRGLFEGPSEKIPFPLDLSEVPWKPAKNANAKLNIIHTPSRNGFKGTDVVLAAIEILKKKRNDFEFSLIQGLAWEKYIAAVSAADVVIDQVWSQSSGMNGLWLLGMGKVVLSGNTTLCKGYFSFGQENPIIDAPPEAQLLANKLESVFDNKQKIPALVEQGRNYVAKHHNHINIAQQHIDLWKRVT